MATKTAKRPSARERLLAASDELLYRDGVHSTGIDAVIEKAGVAKGSLYYIFGGKDELVAAYLRGRLDAWRERVDAAQAGIDDPEEKILAVFDAIADRPNTQMLWRLAYLRKSPVVTTTQRVDTRATQDLLTARAALAR
ncbi:MAG: hypothetical protein QOG37_2004 [Mycobacterium sp.]|jgi:AcrR family transcriptional regulator|nr:hypothetical protein [Mycobacterium sp.]